MAHNSQNLNPQKFYIISTATNEQTFCTVKITLNTQSNTDTWSKWRHNDTPYSL